MNYVMTESLVLGNEMAQKFSQLLIRSPDFALTITSASAQTVPRCHWTAGDAMRSTHGQISA
jgi:hypothetical protein